jgi:prevent-host-death family protein
MSKTYTFTEARQNLKSVLAQAEKDGEVRVSVNRGEKVFVIRLEESTRSPLDVSDINADISREDIVKSVREGREQDPQDRRSSHI